MTNDATTRARQELAWGRSTVYRVLSDLALYPTFASGRPESWPESLQDGEVRLMRATEVLARHGYEGSALEPILAAGQTFFVERDVPLAEEYVRTFGHTVSVDCPPYEAQYQAPHVFQQTRTLADLAGFYRVFGLEVRPDAGERADHLGIELEFLHVLTLKEGYAIEHHGADRADLCRDAQRKFLGDHLGTWVDDFTTRLLQRSEKGPYAAYARALRGYVGAELTYLDVTPSRHKTLHPQTAPPQMPACGLGCGLAWDARALEGGP